LSIVGGNPSLGMLTANSLASKMWDKHQHSGVASQFSPATWLRDIRKAPKARTISRTVWEFRGGFSIESELSRSCVLGQAIGSAIGLCGLKTSQGER